MRIRIFSAFASNNSGSYTLVGRFRQPADAESVARLLQTVSDAHHVWHAGDETGEAPLDALVVEHGLRAAEHGRGDDWPCHGEKPTVLAAGTQILIHAPYTLTLPSVFGELIYAKGGRVETEIDHGHGDIAVEMTYYPHRLKYRSPEANQAIAEFEAEVAERLPPLIARAPYDDRAPVEPAWYRGDHGVSTVAVIFTDLPTGVAAIRAIADAKGLILNLRVFEYHGSAKDPFAHLRATEVPWGRYRVLLWQIGSDRIAAMKAARDALGCGLADAKRALDDLPKELLVDVSLDHAERAREALRRAGCDVEIVAPSIREDG